MKNITMKINYFLLAFVCINWGQQESNTGKEKPQVNFKGTLTDTSGQTYSVENITISGLYKNIPFYAIPLDEKANPESNATLVDLNEVEELKSVPYETQKLQFNNRSYNKVTVALKNKSENTYVVEASRRIFCDIPINGGSIEKRLSFEALKKLVITSHEQREEHQRADVVRKKASEHTHECEQAGKALQELTKEIEKVPGPEKNAISALVDSVKNWVGGICSTPSPEK